MRGPRRDAHHRFTVAHLTTVDLSLWFLLLAQLRAVRDAGGVAIGISAPGPWVEQLEAEGIRHLPLRSSTRSADPLADLRAARELATILRREPIDVLHTHNPKPGVYGRVTGRLVGVPIVVNTVHGLYAQETDPWTRRAAVYGLEAIAARCSDAELLQNSEDLALMERLHLTRRARLLGNGIDLARFDRARIGDATRAEVRAEWGVDDTTIVIGAVGRLVTEKGYPELFDAFATLPRDRYRLVVAGDDDPQKPDTLDRATVQRARDLGVVFLGQRTDVERVYIGFDLFAQPSHREGFPRAAMEAAAMGLPIVATDIRGCRQVVDDGRNGLLVPVRDATRLAAALTTLGDDGERRAAMARAARTIAQERFDERDVVTRVLDTYRDVAARKQVALSAFDA
ncbi:MAG TPA: glycosyltransferase family 4 protein [Acidimicrobiia bacterium]|jgi:glycosyltransferase involved in cell wall biosynthesis